MSNMHNVNIDRFEVGALFALDALLRERSVSRASQQVGLSQPAMSHMLARARKVFGDQLLVRGRKGFLLTEQGECLRAQLGALVPALESLGSSNEFRPQDSDVMFRVACTDHAATVLIPELQRLLGRAASKAVLKVMTVPSRRLDIEQLEGTHFDLLLGFFETLPAHWHAKKLFDERLVVMSGSQTGLKPGDLTVPRFLAMKHVVLSPDERTSQNRAESALAARGMKRNIGLFVSNFASAPFIVSRTDLLAVVPATLATRYSHLPGIRLHDSPVAFPSFPVVMAWHPRVHHDLPGQWLRSQIERAAQAALRIPGSRKRTFGRRIPGIDADD